MSRDLSVSCLERPTAARWGAMSVVFVLATLEEIALELRRDDRLRAMPGEQAAAVWLTPLCLTTMGGA